MVTEALVWLIKSDIGNDDDNDNQKRRATHKPAMEQQMNGVDNACRMQAQSVDVSRIRVLK